MNTDTITHEDRSRSSDEIAADIRETRTRMDSTLDELGNRLTPRSLLNSAFDWWESPETGNQGTATARKAVSSASPGKHAVTRCQPCSSDPASPGSSPRLSARRTIRCGIDPLTAIVRSPMRRG